MKRFILLAAAAVAAAAVLVVVLATAGSSDNGSTAQGAAGKAAPADGAVIGLRKTSLGRILVDGDARTLYLFEADKAGKSACSGACLSIWPPVTSTGAPQLRGAGLTAKVGTIQAGDGKRQVTYNGHPLYRYAGDQQPGDTAGQALNQFGAKWYVLGAAGDKVDND